MSEQVFPYEIKRLCAANIGDVALLHRMVYNRDQPAGFFVKKYNTAYTGVMYLGYLAYNENGLPIAFKGMVPCFLQYGAKNILAAQATDTMTHPAYRKKGLFVKLAELSVELCKENGIRIIFGFPNQNSLPGLVKMGWQIADTMDCFKIPVHRFNWERQFKKAPILRQAYRAYTNYVLKKYTVAQQGLTNSALNEGFDGVYRDDKHLRYKTYSQTTIIKARQALVWLKINDGLIIGDMCLATDNFNAVIRTVLQLARRLGVKQVIFQVSPGTRLHGLFNERYWSMPSFPVIFKELGGRLSLKHIKFTAADIDIF